MIGEKIKKLVNVFWVFLMIYLVYKTRYPLILFYGENLKLNTIHYIAQLSLVTIFSTIIYVLLQKHEIDELVNQEPYLVPFCTLAMAINTISSIICLYESNGLYSIPIFGAIVYGTTCSIVFLPG
ncbi:hypothetical protein A3Q56_02342 [Intoshia linei]|uniref:Uncharacterized protein n=1 Tax=Intoshia linei TaxID=1819745 RepID=A0A177B8E7_9BILA|nr:hypothetical protein A3Q56_02342 [Intoshia linei]